MSPVHLSASAAILHGQKISAYYYYFAYFRLCQDEVSKSHWHAVITRHYVMLHFFLHTMTLLQPIRKYSGDTHIKMIIPEIREAICDELSIEKSHSKLIDANIESEPGWVMAGSLAGNLQN